MAQMVEDDSEDVPTNQMTRDPSMRRKPTDRRFSDLEDMDFSLAIDNVYNPVADRKITHIWTKEKGKSEENSLMLSDRNSFLLVILSWIALKYLFISIMKISSDWSDWRKCISKVQQQVEKQLMKLGLCDTLNAFWIFFIGIKDFFFKVRTYFKYLV